MHWQWLIQKLRYDRPWALVRRSLDRRWRSLERRRRRRNWQGREAVDPSDIPEGFSADVARQLWPGAADRSWVTEAARRWPREHAAATALAANAAEGRFDLLGSGDCNVLDDTGAIRWHEDFKAEVAFPANRLYLDVPICLDIEGSDIKIPWELSRFQHVFAFLWTDPPRYGECFLSQWRKTLIMFEKN